MEAIANLGQWTLQWGLQCPFRHAAAYWKGPYSWRHECPCGDDGNPGRNGVGDAPHGAGSAQVPSLRGRLETPVGGLEIREIHGI